MQEKAAALKLYEHPLSPYARKVKIVLYEKGIPFERVYIAPMTLKADDPAFADFAGASPRLEVPYLVDGDFRCFDSTIIVDYLDEKWPDPPMLPSAPRDRARARMVEELCDTTLDAINWGMMELRFFKRAEGEQAQRMMAKAGEQLAGTWDRLEAALEGPWLSGARFGRADASLIVHVVASSLFGFSLLERHTKLRDWSTRCLAVESVKRDQADLGAFMGSDEARIMRKGPRLKRQYRDHRLEWMFKTGGRDIVLKGLDEETIHFVPWP
jgi:glutathione S-transferase